MVRNIEKEQVRELLNANWMTHDAMWFAVCAREFGIEKTNELNRQAVRGMAAVEAKRLRKALGFKAICSYEDVQAFVSAAFELIRGSFMKFEVVFPGNNRMLWKVPRCFAHDGVRRLGLIDRYECGIVERLFGWFEELKIPYSITPAPEGCHMHRLGQCEMEIVFQF